MMFADVGDGDAEIIQEVKKHPILYNKKRSDHIDRAKKDSTWDQIDIALNRDAGESEIAWKRLRKKYSDICTQRRLMSFSGAGAFKDPEWEHFDAMKSFIVIKHRQQVGNVPRNPRNQTLMEKALTRDGTAGVWSSAQDLIPPPVSEVEDNPDKIPEVDKHENDIASPNTVVSSDETDGEVTILGHGEVTPSSQKIVPKQNGQPRSRLAEKNLAAFRKNIPILPNRKRKADEQVCHDRENVLDKLCNNLNAAVSSYKDKNTTSVPKSGVGELQDAFLLEVATEMKEIIKKQDMATFRRYRKRFREMLEDLHEEFC